VGQLTAVWWGQNVDHKTRGINSNIWVSTRIKEKSGFVVKAKREKKEWELS
jgi:hypothetical protein